MEVPVPIRISSRVARVAWTFYPSSISPKDFTEPVASPVLPTECQLEVPVDYFEPGSLETTMQ
ncbi:MAG: hypothetical protein ACI8P9_000733 [Parasphingorhabdus sp.]|jgi:hypothetical protein